MTETKKKQAHQVTSTLGMPQLSIQQGATVLCIYVHMHMHAHTHTNTHMKFTVNIKKKKWGLGGRDKYIQTCKSWRLRKHDWEKCRKQSPQSWVRTSSTLPFDSKKYLLIAGPFSLHGGIEKPSPLKAVVKYSCSTKRAEEEKGESSCRGYDLHSQWNNFVFALKHCHYR